MLQQNKKTKKEKWDQKTADPIQKRGKGNSQDGDDDDDDKDGRKSQEAWRVIIQTGVEQEVPGTTSPLKTIKQIDALYV